MNYTRARRHLKLNDFMHSRMKTLIIQSGFPRSASTLLVNALLGLIISQQDTAVQFNDFQHTYNYDYDAPLNVFKTHETNLAQLDFRPDFQTYFVCSERAAAGNKFTDRNLPNAVIFDHEYLSAASTSRLCSDLHDIVGYMIPGLLISAEGCVDRVEAMNARYKEIERRPFSYVDPFFNLHGSHRSRAKLRGSK